MGIPGLLVCVRSVVAVCLILGFGGPAPAQAQQEVSSGQLRIEVKKGEGDTHRAGERSGSTIVVSVLDEKDLPVPGAHVTLTVPQPGHLTFTGNRLTETVITDAAGIAQAAPLRSAANVSSEIKITVYAEFEGKSGRLTVTQSNQKKPLVSRKTALITGAACAAVIVPLLSLRSPPPPQATISRPVGTVGAP
jgi:hypothetical protein